VLAVTGAEALYADMGHFWRGPIKLAWFAIVFPSLILNYAGQAALVLEGAPTDGNIFFRLCPELLLLPLIILATIATIIARRNRTNAAPTTVRAEPLQRTSHATMAAIPAATGQSTHAASIPEAEIVRGI